jgi:hypothetical protein
MVFCLARAKQAQMAIAEALAQATQEQPLKVMHRAEQHQASENLPALGKLEGHPLELPVTPVLPAWRSARRALAFAAPTGQLSVP